MCILATNVLCLMSSFYVHEPDLSSDFDKNVLYHYRSKFGERHPMFLEALLQFCHFINEFRQDPIGLQASKVGQ